MSLSRAIAGLLSSAAGPFAGRLSSRHLRLSAAELSTDASTKLSSKKKPTRKPEAEADHLGSAQSKAKGPYPEPPRPAEVPFQPRVANAVHLVGSVGLSPQLQLLPDGTYEAVTVLVNGKAEEFPRFWIPTIFHGDLAQIAAYHLKENDLVYVMGKLRGNAPPIAFKEAQSNVQVLAHSLSYVQKKCLDVGQHPVDGEVESSMNVLDEEENSSVQALWNEFFANPYKWWDNRSNKSYPKSAAFKHKDTCQLLWINESTPEWVLPKLEQLQIGKETLGNGAITGNEKKSDTFTDKSWPDVLLNPQDWKDNREDKRNGSLNPKFPDFKHKDGQALWLNRAPSWVLEKLDTLIFCGSSGTKKAKETGSLPYTLKTEDESLWRAFVDSPNEWWDNRATKLSERHPDFKHKKSGKALWLGRQTPVWVFQKLPPLDVKKIIGDSNKSSPLEVTQGT